MYSLLYVDDEPSLLELAKIYLERTHTFSVTTKISVYEGLELLKKTTFDAIISDYAMPGEDGIEFLKAVRSEYGEIPFILFTGKGREEVAIEALDSGADFYVQKGAQPKVAFAELAHKIKIAIERGRAEQNLRESEQRYKAVVEEATEFICRFSPDGTHNFVNDAYCRYFQKKREDIIGKKFIPLIPAEDQPGLRKHFNSLTRDNPTSTIIHRVIINGGEIRWQRWSDRAIFNDNGVIIEYQSVGRDITSQKETELELAFNRDYLALIFSAVQAGIMVIDAKTHIIVDANPAAVKMIGVEKEQIIGKVCHTFICPIETGKCPVTDLGVSIENSEGLLLTANRENIPIIKYVTSTRLHGRACLLETFIDNTARKQVEEELQAAYFQLSATEKELKEKIRELQAISDKRIPNDRGTGF
jgi:PAS domain S-box-containing protein